MIRIPIAVTMTDGTTYDTVAGPADLVAFEEKYDRSMATFKAEMKLRDIFYLAWHSLTRRKVIDLSWDDFLDAIDDVDVAGAEEIPPSETPPPTG